MKYVILFLGVLITGVSLAQDHSLDCRITGAQNIDVYLADFYGDKNNMLDTVHADSVGTFHFELKPSYHSGLYRIFFSKDIFFDFIYNDEDINLESDIHALYDSLHVKSSVENIIYFSYMRAYNNYRRKFDLLAPLNDYYPRNDSFFLVARTQYVQAQVDIQVYYQQLTEQYPDAWATKIISHKKPLYYDPSMNESDRHQYNLDHYFDHFDFSDIELIRSNVYTTAAIEYMTLFRNPNFKQEQLENAFIQAVDTIMMEAMDNDLVYEFVVDYLVDGFEHYHFDKVLDYISQNYAPDQCENEDRKSDLQTRLERYADLTVGKAAPLIEAPDKDGKTIALKKVRSEYTLVLFWASWCPHCIETLPRIFNLYQNSISTEKMQIYAFSLDNEKDKWLEAIDAGGYSWINVSELKGWDSQAAVDYNVYATPTMFLLDKDKKIVAKPITFEELKAALIKEQIIE